MRNPFQNYQRVEVSTADPMRIVILLYEGAVKNLHQTIRLLGSDDRLASTRLNRTLDIIQYLTSALDHEKGGEIADNLERLYDYMRDRLNEANIHKDPEKIREVITLLQTLLEGWRGISAPHPTAESEAVPAGPDTHPLPGSIKFSVAG